MEDNKSIFDGPKKYLEKSFLEELSYKIWSTKGARFAADKRLNTTAKMSNISLSILSAYLIIASLISVYNIENASRHFNLINYYVTALSIILLVLTQFEGSQDYKIKAQKFHDCGLQLSDLYNELRTFKTLENSGKSGFKIINFCTQSKKREDVVAFCKMLSERYQNILKHYENHRPIDYDCFKITHLEYFKLSKKSIRRIKMKYNWICYGWYSLIIALPPILILVISLL